jgi:ribosomal protein L37AE/L43A
MSLNFNGFASATERCSWCGVTKDLKRELHGKWSFPTDGDQWMHGAYWFEVRQNAAAARIRIVKQMISIDH